MTALYFFVLFTSGLHLLNHFNSFLLSSFTKKITEILHTLLWYATFLCFFIRGGQVHVKTVSHVCHKITAFGEKKFKSGVSQNTCYFYLADFFDPSNFKVTFHSLPRLLKNEQMCHKFPAFFKLWIGLVSPICDTHVTQFLHVSDRPCFSLARTYNRLVSRQLMSTHVPSTTPIHFIKL